MADDDWYRGDAWGRKDRERFEAKLARARPENRPEYLRIKGLSLTESTRKSRQDAGVELLERLLRDHPDAWPPERAGAHSHLARLHLRRGDLARAVDELRKTNALDRGTNVDHGGRLRLGALLAEHPEFAEHAHEAAELLELEESSLLFGSDQFDWAVAQARLASRAGAHDRAAALARGAQWLAAHDEPAAPRHPLVGLIGTPDRAVQRELHVLASAGDAEAASPRVDEFRRPDGTVEWHWALTTAIVADDVAAVAPPVADDEPARPERWIDDEAADDAVFEEERRAVLAELRAVGFHDAFELIEWTNRKFGSAAEVKLAAPILVRWLRDGRSYQTRIAAAYGLKDTRARKLAADQVVASYAALRDPNPGVIPPPDFETARIRRERDALGDVLASVARDGQFDALAKLVREDARSRIDHDPWVWMALSYVKDPRVVDLALEHVGETGAEDHAVLRALGNLRTERAEPVLQAIAARPKPRTVPISRFDLTEDPEHDAPLWAQEHERFRVIIAEDGLAKLAKARAAGKARP